ncbi:TIGR01906 family membrane protein [Sinomonas notoginsengisoli]|uniref:TIGR01906 family membrane protein n=1 Tax=Sinomonas notoginsengisoli TaxID=1457311 RepID=UPI001F491BCD|nr:TIGR01906 family membrane protein [Sinomonas notoginsengisoli]
MTDNRPGSESGADFDESRDSDEPAFEWMTNARRSGAHTADGAAEPAAAGKPKDERAPDSSRAGEAPVSTEKTVPREEPVPHREPAPTGALNVRPPEEEVRRRRDQRDAVARSKPAGRRVVQVLMAILAPFLLLISAVRLVASPAFLWIEYYRPGFPGDGYGFTADDRLTYGSYAVDFLANLAGPRYLGDLVFPSGEHLFTGAEVSHMADVKGVVLAAYGAGIILVLFFVIAYLGLRKTPGAFTRGLFAGGFVTIAVIVALAVLAVLGWQQFFMEFHRLFFANGTWTFRLEDTLIRLFPGQFWVDSAAVVGVLVALAASLMVIFCWPTPRRRGRRSVAREVDSAEDHAE